MMEVSQQEYDEHFMQIALEMATLAEKHNEVPIGAVVVYQQKIIATGFNQSIMNHDPSAHAEMIAIRDAANYLNNYRLVDCQLYVTLEPCIMCAGLLLHSRIKRVIFGAGDSRNGALGSQINVNNIALLNHKLEITQGIFKEECQKKLKDFFKSRRSK